MSTQQEDRATTADTVRAELARKRGRQADLAAALGISQPALSRRLSGSRSFSVEELQATARFLDVDPVVLLGSVKASA